MAIRRDVKYPGRWTPADTAFPMGGPKNRTTNTAKDGSYFDREWIADYEAFYQRLMSEAGIVANGSSDTAPTSQFYNALIVESTKATVAWWDSIPKGTAFNKNFGSVAGTVCQGNDSRLSNPREWIADIVTQAEAEGGESNTPRKWTAQRVHQAFKKFGIGKSFASSDVSNNADNFFVENPTCFYAANFSGDAVIPGGESYGYQFKTVGGFGHRFVIRAGGDLRAFIQRISGNNIQTAVELIHSLNEKFLGVNQSTTDVTTLRQSNVVYTNSTNKPIVVFISMDQTTSVSVDCHQIRENASSSWITVGGKSTTALTNVSYIVPVGYQYRCQRSDIISWSELR